VLPEGAEPDAQAVELDIYVSETACERLELVRLLLAVDASGELADPPLDPQTLGLEL
jgi:hypothetical protein